MFNMSFETIGLIASNAFWTIFFLALLVATVSFTVLCINHFERNYPRNIQLLLGWAVVMVAAPLIILLFYSVLLYPANCRFWHWYVGVEKSPSTIAKEQMLSGEVELRGKLSVEYWELRNKQRQMVDASYIPDNREAALKATNAYFQQLRKVEKLSNELEEIINKP